MAPRRFVLTLQLVAVRGAGSLVHEAPEVVVEQSVVAQDRVQVDVVELGRVLVLWHGAHSGRDKHHQTQHSQSTHVSSGLWARQMVL